MRIEEAKEKGIDLEELKQEQKKLAKAVSQKDAFDFSVAQRFGGIISETVGKQIVSAIVVLNENFEVIDQKFSIQKPQFPYIPGFRAYRELRVMLDAYNKLEEKPDVVFVFGHGISHPRGCGIATHFALSIQKPTIGIAKSLVCGEEKDNQVYLLKKIIGEKVVTKEGSRPFYVSVGNDISLKTAVELTKKQVRENHKLPEPLIEVRKFVKEVRKEVVKV
ncbi:MAG: endonuclease V [archaeon]|nr:MAG: endonuclease V [archaeon]